MVDVKVQHEDGSNMEAQVVQRRFDAVDAAFVDFKFKHQRVADLEAEVRGYLHTEMGDINGMIVLLIAAQQTLKATTDRYTEALDDLVRYVDDL